MSLWTKKSARTVSKGDVKLSDVYHETKNYQTNKNEIEYDGG